MFIACMFCLTSCDKQKGTTYVYDGIIDEFRGTANQREEAKIKLDEAKAFWEKYQSITLYKNGTTSLGGNWSKSDDKITITGVWDEPFVFVDDYPNLLI